MAELYTGTPQTTNVLSMLLNRKWAQEDQAAAQNTPSNLLAAKQLETYDANQNYLTQQREQESQAKTLQYEKDLMQYAVDSLKQVEVSEYPQYRANLIRFGFNKELLPESFASTEEFQAWKNKSILGATEYNKLLEGNEATLSKLNDNGTISTVKAKGQDEVKAYMGQGYQMGTLTGTSEKKQYEHKPVYNEQGQITGWTSVEKGKDFTYPEGQYGSGTKSTTGTLSENQVVASLQELASATVQNNETIETKYADYYSQYRKLVDSGMSREAAYNQVLSGANNTAPVTEGTEKTGSYSYLWE